MSGRTGIKEIDELEEAIVENIEVWEEYKKNSEYVRNHYKELQEDYGGKYIGVMKKGEVIISNEDGKKLIEELRKICKDLDKDLGESYTPYIPKKDENIILTCT